MISAASGSNVTKEWQANGLLSLNLRPYLKKRKGAKQKTVATAARMETAMFDPSPTNITSVNYANAQETRDRVSANAANADAAYVV